MAEKQRKIGFVGRIRITGPMLKEIQQEGGKCLAGVTYGPDGIAVLGVESREEFDNILRYQNVCWQAQEYHLPSPPAKPESPGQIAEKITKLSEAERQAILRALMGEEEKEDDKPEIGKEKADGDGEVQADRSQKVAGGVPSSGGPAKKEAVIGGKSTQGQGNSKRS